MNIEQKSTKNEISEQDCLKVQGGTATHHSHIDLATQPVAPDLEKYVEEAEKPGSYA